jgi:hypothetical protein
MVGEISGCRCYEQQRDAEDNLHEPWLFLGPPIALYECADRGNYKRLRKSEFHNSGEKKNKQDGHRAHDAGQAYFQTGGWHGKH